MYNYDLIGFGEKLKNLRNEVSLTQLNVYEKTGVSVDSIRKIENGLKLMKPSTYIALGTFYKIDVLEVLIENYRKCN